MQQLTYTGPPCALDLEISSKVSILSSSCYSLLEELNDDLSKYFTVLLPGVDEGGVPTSSYVLGRSNAVRRKSDRGETGTSFQDTSSSTYQMLFSKFINVLNASSHQARAKMSVISEELDNMMLNSRSYCATMQSSNQNTRPTEIPDELPYILLYISVCSVAAKEGQPLPSFQEVVSNNKTLFPPSKRFILIKACLEEVNTTLQLGLELAKNYLIALANDRMERKWIEASECINPLSHERERQGSSSESMTLSHPMPFTGRENTIPNKAPTIAAFIENEILSATSAHITDDRPANTSFTRQKSPLSLSSTIDHTDDGNDNECSADSQGEHHLSDLLSYCYQTTCQCYLAISQIISTLRDLNMLLGQIDVAARQADVGIIGGTDGEFWKLACDAALSAHSCDEMLIMLLSKAPYFSYYNKWSDKLTLDWLDFERQYSTNLPLAKNHLTMCVLYVKQKRHQDAYRHANLSLMILQSLVNSKGVTQLELSKIGLQPIGSTSDNLDHPLRLLVIAYYNLGVTSEHCNPHDDAMVYYQEAYRIATTPVPEGEGAHPALINHERLLSLEEESLAIRHRRDTLLDNGKPLCILSAPPYISSDPLVITLRDILGIPQPMERYSNNDPTGAVFPSPPKSGGYYEGSRENRGRSHSRLNEFSRGDLKSRSYTSDVVSYKSASSKEVNKPIIPTVGGEEFSSIPFVAVSMGQPKSPSTDVLRKLHSRGKRGITNLYNTRPATYQGFPQDRSRSSRVYNSSNEKLGSIPRPPIRYGRKSVPTARERRHSVSRGSVGSRVDDKQIGITSLNKKRHASESLAKTVDRGMLLTTTQLKSQCDDGSLSVSVDMPKLDTFGVRRLTIQSLSSQILTNIISITNHAFQRRSNAARTIQCSWRCAKSRMEAHNRHQVFYYYLHCTQKSAVTCIVTSLKTFILKRKTTAKKEAILNQLIHQANKDRRVRRAILTISYAVRRYIRRRQEDRRIMELFRIEKESKLIYYREAAIAIQRWWPIIKERKKYWRAANDRINREKEARRLMKMKHDAATTIQRHWRGKTARLYVKIFKKEILRERAERTRRIRESIDCVRIALQEFARRKRRLERERMEFDHENDPEVIERRENAELLQRMAKKAQHDLHRRMLQMDRAARVIQRCSRCFRARRDLRFARKIACVNTIIRIENEVKYYLAARKIQCFVRQRLARNVIRRKKATIGRNILRDLTIISACGRGYLTRRNLIETVKMTRRMIEDIVSNAIRFTGIIEGFMLAKMITEPLVLALELKHAEERKALHVAVRRSILDDKAARTIQSNWTSRRTRAQTRERVVEFNNRKSFLLQMTVKVQSFARMVIDRSYIRSVRHILEKERDDMIMSKLVANARMVGDMVELELECRYQIEEEEQHTVSIIMRESMGNLADSDQMRSQLDVGNVSDTYDF